MPTWAISAASRSASPGSSSCMPALMLNYMGQGAMLLSLDPAAGDRDGQEPVLLPRARSVPPAARHPRHAGDDHRQPGGDLRRLLGHPAGDPARLHPAPADPPHQRGGRRARSTSRSINWALMVMVILLVLFFQTSSQPRRRLWHRGDRRDVHRHLPARGRAVLAVEVEPLAGGAAARHLLHRRHRLFRAEPDQGARRRLVPAAGRRSSSSPCSPPGPRAAS